MLKLNIYWAIMFVKEKFFRINKKLSGKVKT